MGVPISRVAKNLKIGRTTIYKYLKEAQAPELRA